MAGKKKQIDADKFANGVLIGTIVALMLGGVAEAEVLYNVTNGDAAINTKAQGAYETKMDVAERELEHLSALNNALGVELPDGFDVGQAKSKYLQDIAPIKMAEAQEEAERARMHKGKRVFIDALGGIAGGVLGLIAGDLITRPLAKKVAIKLNRVIVGKRKEDNESTIS